MRVRFSFYLGIAIAFAIVRQQNVSDAARLVLSASFPSERNCNMNIWDLTKATVFCGGVAFLFYSFPGVAQGVTIGLLTLLWLGYAHRTIASLRRR